VLYLRPHGTLGSALALQSVFDPDALVENVLNGIFTEPDLKLFRVGRNELGIVNVHDLLASCQETVDHPLAQV
jgi:hypothetical protein